MTVKIYNEDEKQVANAEVWISTIAELFDTNIITARLIVNDGMIVGIEKE